MISSLLLLSATLFATPVFISDVKASREAGHLRVEVRGDGGIDPDAARTVIDDGRLVIYLGGARVRADNRSWELQDGAGEIRAHRHKNETELVVPLAGNGCAGPVELTGSPSGITALVGCEGAVSNVPARREIVAKVSKKPSPEPVTLKKLVELPGDDLATAPSPVAAAPIGADSVVAKVAPAQPARPTATPEMRVEAASVVPVPPPVVAAPSVKAALATVAKRPTTEVAPQSAPANAVVPPTGTSGDGTQAGIPAAPSGGLKAVLVPGFLLGALALAAYLFARRRRSTTHRHIEILETASLGPKRALVVARIGDETIILGSSEAGITLLRGGSSLTPAHVAEVAQIAAASAPASASTNAAVPTVVAPGPSELDQPIEEALADIPQPDSGRGSRGRAGFRAIEGGLAGLFNKRGGGFDKAEAAPVFDDLLEDSIEDQELRRKLAAGLSSRVR